MYKNGNVNMSDTVINRKDKWQWTVKKGRKKLQKGTISFDAGKYLRNSIFLLSVPSKTSWFRTCNEFQIYPPFSRDGVRRGLSSITCFISI